MKNIFKTMLAIGIIKKVIIVLVLLTTSLNAQLDRSIMPESGPAPEIFFGKPQTFKLDNGTLVDIKNLGTYMIYATDDKTEYWASHVYI